MIICQEKRLLSLSLSVVYDRPNMQNNVGSGHFVMVHLLSKVLHFGAFSLERPNGYLAYSVIGSQICSNGSKLYISFYISILLETHRHIHRCTNLINYYHHHHHNDHRLVAA